MAGPCGRRRAAGLLRGQRQRAPDAALRKQTSRGISNSARCDGSMRTPSSCRCLACATAAQFSIARRGVSCAPITWQENRETREARDHVRASSQRRRNDDYSVPGDFPPRPSSDATLPPRPRPARQRLALALGVWRERTAMRAISPEMDARSLGCGHLARGAAYKSGKPFWEIGFLRSGLLDSTKITYREFLLATEPLRRSDR